MEQGHSSADEHHLPFDKYVKLILLAFHFLGFSVWYGGVWLDTSVPALYPYLSYASGALLVARELYDDGLAWLSTTEGVLTWLKVFLMAIAFVLSQQEVVLLSVVLACGLLGSHLPDTIKKKRLLPWPAPRPC